jgi:hypothetical protein
MTRTVETDPLWQVFSDLPVAQLRRNHRNLLVQASRVRRQDQVDELLALADRLERIIKVRKEQT